MKTAASTNLRLLTIKAAAEQLGDVPVATVYRLVAERLIAHTRLVGGQHPRIYIRETDLAAYVESCRVPSVTEQRTPLARSWMVPGRKRLFS